MSSSAGCARRAGKIRAGDPADEQFGELRGVDLLPELANRAHQRRAEQLRGADAVEDEPLKALVYGGPGKREWKDVPKPEIKDPTDAIVHVTAITICGTDLHILKGDVPEVEPGRILGHGAVGVVERVGASVTGLKPGDRVLLSCITTCGRCSYCRTGSYGQCLGGGGWILGHLVDDVQAEYVRVPFADTSTHLLPADVSDTAAVVLADILPTAYEVGVLNGAVKPATPW